MSNPTQGPWHVDFWETVIYAADGFEVVDVGQGPHLHETYTGNDGHWWTTPGSHVERSKEEERANARLIAAAPEMLAALKLLHKWFEITGSSINARWDRIPPLERKAIVDATKAAVAKAEGRS